MQKNAGTTASPYYTVSQTGEKHPRTLTLKCRKHQKQTTNDKNPDLKTQNTPETNNQGEKTRKPEICRARRRRESQLTTAAPASRFIYVELDSPRERAGYVDLEAPRTAYGPR